MWSNNVSSNNVASEASAATGADGTTTARFDGDAMV